MYNYLESHTPHDVRTTSPRSGGLGGRDFFRPISMPKGDLALMYFPESPSRRVALRRLERWINVCQPLMDELSRTGYPTKHHWFTARQVRLIAEYFDPP